MVEYIVELENVSKKFRIYHEKRNSVFESVVGYFSKKKYYEELPILKDVNFGVKKGEMFGIVGRNGIGKTTLLRIIAGIYKPDKGKVITNGNLLPFLGLGVGFQIELTARANVIQYGILLGFKKNQIESLVDDIMKFAELEKFADTKLKNFSSGMFARLAFATAIQVDPDIMIIDEVLQVGDMAFQQKSQEAILSFKKKDKAIILVTHDMTYIRNYCDRAMFLNQGEIEAIGSPNMVVDAYSKSMALG